MPPTSETKAKNCGEASVAPHALMARRVHAQCGHHICSTPFIGYVSGLYEGLSLHLLFMCVCCWPGACTRTNIGETCARPASCACVQNSWVGLGWSEYVGISSLEIQDSGSWVKYYRCANYCCGYLRCGIIFVGVVAAGTVQVQSFGPATPSA